MNQTMQPVGVLIGSDQDAFQHIRVNLARRSLAVHFEFADFHRALERLPVDTPERTFFFFEIRKPADIKGLEKLSNAFTGCPIAAIFTAPHENKAVMDAMRAGAAQVIPFPMDRDDLDAAINRLLIQYGHYNTTIRTIAVCGIHGGTGGITIALNLAHVIASANEVDLRCLVAESVRSAGTIVSFLGLHPRYTAVDFLDAVDQVDAEVLRRLLTELAPKLHLLPAPRGGLPRFATEEEYQTLERLAPQIADIAVVYFEFFNNQTILSRIAESNYCLVVADHSVQSVDALKAVCDLLRSQSATARPIPVINAFDPANKDLTVSVMQNLLGTDVHTIRDDPAAVQRAANAGALLQSIAPDSVAVEDIRALARAILKLSIERQPTRHLLGWMRDWFSK